MKKLLFVILSTMILLTLISCATLNESIINSTEDSNSINTTIADSSAHINVNNNITLSPAPIDTLCFVRLSELATFVELLDGDEEALIEYVTELKSDSDSGEKYTNAQFEVKSKEELVTMWQEMMSVSVPVGTEDFAIHYVKDSYVATIQFIDGVRVMTKTYVDGSTSTDKTASTNSTATIVKNINIKGESVDLREIVNIPETSYYKYMAQDYVTLDNKLTSVLFQYNEKTAITNAFPVFEVKTVAEIVAKYIGKQ